MTLEEIRSFVKEEIKYKDWEFHIGTKDNAIFLQVRFMAADNYHPEVTELQYCRKFQLSTWMTKTEIVQTAWLAVSRALLHEASEQFLYRGKDIFNTHMSVDKLWDVRTNPHALEHRAPKE